MPSKGGLAALRDIVHHVALAESFAEGATYETFRFDLKSLFAVIRCLEVTSEASRRLTPEIQARHPHMPWRDIAGAGNVYRHARDDVAARWVWKTLSEDLQPLRRAVAAEWRRLGDDR